jgi:hypothetical protein
MIHVMGIGAHPITTRQTLTLDERAVREQAAHGFIGNG